MLKHQFHQLLLLPLFQHQNQIIVSLSKLFLIQIFLHLLRLLNLSLLEYLHYPSLPYSQRLSGNFLQNLIHHNLCISSIILVGQNLLIQNQLYLIKLFLQHLQKNFHLIGLFFHRHTIEHLPIVLPQFHMLIHLMLMHHLPMPLLLHLKSPLHLQLLPNLMQLQPMLHHQ